MKEEKSLGKIRTVSARTVVLGSGAAALNAAALLKKGGEDDLLLVTEGMNCGTSRNTGSDKQTYYKLSLSGSDGDSVHALARDLYSGRCVDGDIALVEASLSVPSFIRLTELGVPFPTNRYGEFVGYKTDHDNRKRATSAGPYTSKYMTECLEKEVHSLGIEVLDGWLAVRILVRDNCLRGLVLVRKTDGEILVLLSNTLVFATGGPGGMYEDSAYPVSQFGATGIAFEAGCMGGNLTEWQYGLASVKPRWNVSGSFMQVLPRFVSIDQQGIEHEFLYEHVYTRPEMLSRIFLKGYQWPFDVRKLANGSSIVDAMCYMEFQKGRKVYLDYMHNPGKEDIPWDLLSQEARGYLQEAGATGSTPLERLRKLNEPAYDFYLDKGVDLALQYLEISLCAQHNNGGLSINTWWESNIKGLFPVGEVAASHGVYRPGGSALNAGQCGSRRAVNWILRRRAGFWEPNPEGLEKEILEIKALAENAVSKESVMPDKDNAEFLYRAMRKRMSLCGAAIREKTGIGKLASDIKDAIGNLEHAHVSSRGRIWMLFQYRNALLTQYVYLRAMENYMEHGGKSRGSALYCDNGGDERQAGLGELFTYSLEDVSEPSQLQEVLFRGLEDVSFSWRFPRPIPEDDDFFESMWARYRQDGCVY